ncbi:MAG: DUF4143 domain-containing protein, partial [Candidatus Wallbacteria bacterium]|nr:DUF4143 domain-containing protein [Candidatus Wallbacteria bacterium]
LEKSFVVFRLTGFSRNLRKEITRNDKIFFYDLGIRNMVIGNFNTLSRRNDAGALWENLLIVERLKKLSAARIRARAYFWRTYTGAELDYLEEHNGELRGYEFKYGAKRVRCPASWSQVYPGASCDLINRENYLDFIG